MEGIVWRPVPVECVTFWSSPEPVPIHIAPQARYPFPQFALRWIVRIKVLPRREQALHQKRRLDQVGSVVVDAEERNHMTCPAVHEVRPCTVEAIRMCEKA